MTLWPYLILHNWLPYKDIAIAHTPILIITLSLWYKTIGLGLIQLKIFTWIIILVTSTLVFLTTGGNKKQKTAVLATVLYIFLNIIFEGNGLWFDLLLAPLALLLYVALEKKHLFLSGVIFAIMFFTKQTAIWFAPVFLLLFLTQKKKLEDIKKSALGFMSAALIFILILSLFGILQDFLHWAIEFGIFTLPRAQGQISPPAIKQIIFALLPFSILPFTKNKKITLFAILGALGAFPRFELFHFQPALPFLALAAADLLSGKNKKILLPYLALIAAMFIFTFLNFQNRNSRFYETDTLDVASYLDAKTQDGTLIYIVNDWDNIYALSNTLPAIDPWVPYLSWYMTPDIQKAIVSNLEKAKPQYIIEHPFDQSGLGAFKPEIIMNYIYSHYQKSGTLDGRELLIRK